MIILKKSIIFDLDGTLWDTTVQVNEVWNKIAKKYNLEISSERIKDIMGMTKEEIINFIFENNIELGNKFISECQIAENKYLKENGGTIYVNTLNTLKKLKKSGFDLYIVSNCQDGYIQSFLEYYNLDNKFKDYECSGRTGKSKEENIRMIMQRNNLIDAMYVGDTQKDYISAKNNKIDFVWAKYGFGKCNGSVKRINDICELIDIVNS